MDIEVMDRESEKIQSPKKAVAKKIKKRNTKFTDSFSEEIFNLTYKYENEADVNDRHLNVALDLASVEKPELRDYWTE